MACCISVFVSAPALAQPSAVPVLQVDIDMRAEIEAGKFNPQTDSVGIRGSIPPLAWDRSTVLKASDPAHYRGAVSLSQAAKPGDVLQYKFKIDRLGQGPGDGWEQGRNHTLALDTPTPTIQRIFNATPSPPPLSRVGRIDRLPAIRSLHVSPLAVQVWLPPGYESDTQRNYPVLYLHDGQALFDTAVNAAEWQVDETAQRLVEDGAIAPCIIVAVDNGPQRIADYTPTPGRLSTRPGASQARVGGNASAYARFLIEELKPLIDQRYRTQTQASATSVGGSSLGGLASLWLAVNYPQTFGAALVVSPSVWWDERAILGDVMRHFQFAKTRPRIWLDVGLLEGKEAVDDVRALHVVLTQLGWDASSLHYLEQPDGAHDEASWAKRVQGMLVFLYGKN